MDAPEPRPQAEELLAFDGRPLGPLTVRRVVPVASVSAEEVLALAARADWPANPALTEALRKAADGQEGRGQTEVVTRLSRPPDETEHKATPQWHAIPYQGIDGCVGPFHVLIGTLEFLEDAGIPIPETARTVLVDHERAGWASLAIGAFHTNGRRPAHRSLIGVLAIGPQDRRADAPDRKKSSLSQALASPLVVSQATRLTRCVLRAVRGIRNHFRVIAVVVAGSAAAGLWLSSVRVETGQVALVTRFGRTVAVLGPGLYVRPAWMLETVRHIAPEVERTIAVGSNVIEIVPEEENGPAVFEQLFLSGDLWPTGTPSEADEAAPDGQTAISPGFPLAVTARVSYVIAAPRTYASVSPEADRLVGVASEAVLRQLVAGVPMTAAMGAQRGPLADRAAGIIQQKLDAWDTGLRVTRVLIDEVQPWPGNARGESAGWLGELADAQVRRSVLVSEARTKAVRCLADARQRGAELLAEASRDKQARIEVALAHEAQVKANLTAYALDPAQTRRRLLAELIAQTPAAARRRLLEPAVRRTVSELIEQAMGARHQSSTSSLDTQPAAETAKTERDP